MTGNPPRARGRGRWRRRSGGGTRFRRLVHRLVLLMLAGLVLRTWYFEGLFVPFEVVGGSMADTLFGEHREVACGDCGRRFACAADDGPAIHPRAVCPGCGFTGNDLQGQPDVAGDRLLVEKSIFSIRGPRRWEPVVFRHPGRPGEVCVKRVVGLPGESVQIRRGDVYVNGEIQRKTLAQQRAVAVLVHDAGHAPRITADLPPRWIEQSGDSGWGSANGRFAHPADGEAESVDWLVYRHWRRMPGEGGQAYETRISNHRGYNQTQGQRAENVHPITDVMLSFRLVRAFGDGRLLARATDGREVFQVVIDPVGRRYEVFGAISEGGSPIFAAGKPGQSPIVSPELLGGGTLPEWTEGLHVEVSLFDRQLLVALDGRTALVHAYESADRQREPTSRPLAIGSQGLGVEIRDLRVYRDVYYTRPIGLEGRWGLDDPVRLGAGEYFVLGDNSGISEDSRSWAGGPAVPARLLIGKPFLVHFPARRVEVGGWHFQVPDPARIRYIR